MIKSDEHRQPVEVLCEDFLDRWRKGEAPTIEEYVTANESLSDDIQAVFPALLAMENVKLDRCSKSSSSSSRPIRLEVDRLEQLGDYRIIREIGRGGMAIVYEAEQQSLHRRVAVKVFPQQAIGDSKHLQRFQREARTVAGLHHTNIVPVFGIGEQDGLHYFVMQLLNGISLDGVIEELRQFSQHQAVYRDPLQQIVGRKLSAEPTSAGESNVVKAESDPGQQDQGMLPTVQTISQPRGGHFWQQIADLGRQVAAGLHYAHEQGVLHRDIKPSNLVIDTDWRVWITDFGLAIGMVQDRLSRTGDVIGTLRYMAPEQLQGEIDVRSDVYSLGLTIYELVTQRPAFDGNGRGELTHQVLNTLPPAPHVYCPDIPRDLETIILKAISRQPKDRYQSAAEMAKDFSLFYHDQPILARRITRLERLSRWSFRNPALATLSAALAVCMLVSVTAITVNWRVAIAEKQRAESESARAESNLVLALDSMNRFVEKYDTDWMSHPVARDSDSTDAEEPVPESTSRFIVSDENAAVLQEALLFYDQFAKRNAGNPKLQWDTAIAYRRAGGLHDRLGQYAQAEEDYRKSVQMFDSLAHEKEADEEFTTYRASTHNRLAMDLYADNKLEAALQELESAKLHLGTYLLGDENSLPCRYELALVNSNMGTIYWVLKKRDHSVRCHRRAIVLLENLVEERPKVAIYRLSLARAYRDYYPFAAFGREKDYSNEIQKSAESLLSNLVEDFPDVPDYQCELSEMLAATVSHGDGTEAQKLEQASRAVDLAQQLLGQFRMIPRYRAALAESLTMKASLVEDSMPEDAVAIHARSVQCYASLCEDFPSVVQYQSFNARALRNYARCLETLNDVEKARDVYRLAIEHLRMYLERSPSTIFGKKRLADILHSLASLEEKDGNPDLAAALNEEAQETWKPWGHDSRR